MGSGGLRGADDRRARRPPGRRRRAGAIDADSLRAVYAKLPVDARCMRPATPPRACSCSTRSPTSGSSRISTPVEWAGAAGADLANVEVRLGQVGSDAPLLVLSAHYDTVPGTAGADDDGSGTVVLLELARRLAGRPLSIELALVWFDAEEEGLIGSGRYVEALPPDQRKRLMGAINLETIGYTDRRPGSQRLPAGAKALFDPGDRGDFLLIVGNLQSALLGRAVFEGLQPEHGPQFRSELFALLPGAGWLIPDSRRSDHARFWDEELPAVMLTDTANMRSPHYHQPTDTVETLDLEFLAAAARGLERAVLRLSEQGAPPPTLDGSGRPPAEPPGKR
jgi:hypothetical protein